MIFIETTVNDVTFFKHTREGGIRETKWGFKVTN